MGVGRNRVRSQELENHAPPQYEPREARLGRIVSVLGLVAGVAAIAVFGLRESKATDPLAGRPRVKVHRGDLHVTLRAAGLVNSSQKTLIECEVEAAQFSNNGRAISANGSTTILSLIPDGTTVREGDVICRLDSSEYEELVRQQQIQVEESRDQFDTSRHELEASEARLFEYREGTLEQTKQQLQGLIALARADVQRQLERLAWTEKMIGVKYLPENRRAQERQTLDRLQIELNQKLLGLTNLEKFSAPKQIIAMESQIAAARSNLTYGQMRLDRHVERLEYFQKQVDRCTIRAPHDGFLIYANENNNDTRIETGARVRQKQDLFFLPDMTRMEVQTVLHETIVDRVKDGMPAQVRVEALRICGSKDTSSPWRRCPSHPAVVPVPMRSRISSDASSSTLCPKVSGPA